MTTSTYPSLQRPRWVLCKQNRKRLQVDTGVTAEGILVGWAECGKCHQVVCPTGLHSMASHQPGLVRVEVSRPGFPSKQVPVCRQGLCGRLWEQCVRARVVWLVYPDGVESDQFVALFTEWAKGDPSDWMTVVAQHMLSLHDELTAP